jgi:hypothetical protein
VFNELCSFVNNLVKNCILLGAFKGELMMEVTPEYFCKMGGDDRL